jgi:hypothetical protein
MRWDHLTDGNRGIAKGMGRKCVCIGARGGTRTPDAHLRTVALYPLSYTGMSNENGSQQHASTGYAAGPASATEEALHVNVHFVRTLPMCGC